MDGLSLLSNTLFTGHRGQSGRGPSPRVWHKAHAALCTPDGADLATFFFDDFIDFYPVTVTSAAAELRPGGGYFAYIEVDATVGSIRPSAAYPGGVITLLTSTDAADGDNHDTVLTTGGNVGTLGMISDTAADAKLTVFEARFRLPTITNGQGSYFIGMGEEGLGAANTPLVDSTGHTLSSDDLIGFVVLEGDNDALKFVYRKNGAALVTVLTHGEALVADTWYKVGFVYDPNGKSSERITIYVDNEEEGTYVTAANIAASTFPDGEELALVAAVKGSADNAPRTMLLDWWGFFQAG